ncbi:TfoX/Sxy family DNA transformation protein [Chachezhania sediminis]|uniref:TfoX/Sxy family DNA transformation protein n=1 Tax=Chachezhania sediminis TaxID=2599291 RepID=UPI00131BEF14|nr:TfoX/Sxy family DNA transformation protein [Chachezhania sediminis]
MSQPVSSIKNLGPAFEKACGRAGIHSAEELHALGPDEAYRKLLASGYKPNFVWYFVLVMALAGRPWNDAKGAEKEALRARFDALKAERHDPAHSAFEAMLDTIGVIEKRRA